MVLHLKKRQCLHCESWISFPCMINNVLTDKQPDVGVSSYLLTLVLKKYSRKEIYKSPAVYTTAFKYSRYSICIFKYPSGYQLVFTLINSKGQKCCLNLEAKVSKTDLNCSLERQSLKGNTTQFSIVGVLRHITRFSLSGSCHTYCISYLVICC